MNAICLDFFQINSLGLPFCVHLHKTTSTILIGKADDTAPVEERVSPANANAALHTADLNVLVTEPPVLPPDPAAALPPNPAALLAPHPADMNMLPMEPPVLPPDPALLDDRDPALLDDFIGLHGELGE